jgi:DNA-binding transcriptional LysR family regulator
MPSYFDRLDWDKLKSFYVVALNESFTKASLQMNLTQSALSRHISAIEYQLDSQLFIRGSERLSLTSKGKILFESVSKMIEETKMARALIDEEDSNPRGHLTIATTHAFANIWLLEHIPDFLEYYPEIGLNIVIQDNLNYLYTRHFDALIGISPPSQLTFIYEKIIESSLGLYANLDYLEEFGIPSVINDLDNHRLISFGDRAEYNGTQLNSGLNSFQDLTFSDGGFVSDPYKMVDWLLHIGCETGKLRKPYLEINSFYGMLKLAERGVGIITLANNNPAIKKLGLIRVLPEIEGPVVETFLNYSKTLENSKKIKALKNFLKRIFTDEK